jgi:hypothetical protein
MVENSGIKYPTMQELNDAYDATIRKDEEHKLLADMAAFNTDGLSQQDKEYQLELRRQLSMVDGDSQLRKRLLDAEEQESMLELAEARDRIDQRRSVESQGGSADVAYKDPSLSEMEGGEASGRLTSDEETGIAAKEQGSSLSPASSVYDVNEVSRMSMGVEEEEEGDSAVKSATEVAADLAAAAAQIREPLSAAEAMDEDKARALLEYLHAAVGVSFLCIRSAVTSWGWRKEHSIDLGSTLSLQMCRWQGVLEVLCATGLVSNSAPLWP